MKIGVVSDTHSKEIPKQLLDDFKKADLIIHAGDFCTMDVFEQLNKVQDTMAVSGNMDSPDIKQLFPKRQIIEVEGIKIGVTHGEGPSNRVRDYVVEEFEYDDVDVVVFGHAHSPCNEIIKGILYFNPGSPNDDIFAPYCSYGLLEIKDGKVKGKIKKVGR